jgi:NAD(P)-dependent dehydrogenase (short-subunit alcohol dehydrogenase family)
MLLKNKNIVIFGGTGLIGQELVKTVLQNGANVTVASRSVDKSVNGQLDKRLRRNLATATLDITNSNSVDNFFQNLKTESCDIDAMVNCTLPIASGYGAKLEEVAYEDFCNNVVAHLGGAFLVCQKAAIYFTERGGGNIINFASVYGFLPPRFEIYKDSKITKEVEYVVCKSAIIQLTKYLAKYLKGRNIRANCVSPGGVIDGHSEEFMAKYASYCMSKGMLASNDVTGTVLFLLSDQSRFITGQNIVVDDGFTL